MKNVDASKSTVNIDSADIEKEQSRSAQSTNSPDRRQLIKKLGKAAVLPMVTATFIATDVTDAQAY